MPDCLRGIHEAFLPADIRIVPVSPARARGGTFFKDPEQAHVPRDVTCIQPAGEIGKACPPDLFELARVHVRNDISVPAASPAVAVLAYGRGVVIPPGHFRHAGTGKNIPLFRMVNRRDELPSVHYGPAVRTYAYEP